MVEQDALAGRLLRAHVANRARQVAGQRQAPFGLKLSEAEVGDPQLAAGVEQQIPRLDVAMNHAHLVRVLQGLGRLDAQPRGNLIERQPFCSPLRRAQPCERCRLAGTQSVMLRHRQAGRPGQAFIGNWPWNRCRGITLDDHPILGGAAAALRSTVAPLRSCAISRIRLASVFPSINCIA